MRKGLSETSRGVRAILLGFTESDKAESGSSSIDFISLMMTLFWRLHDAQPQNPLTAPVCVPGKRPRVTVITTLDQLSLSILLELGNHGSVHFH